MIAVSNTTPIITLASIGMLDIFKAFFSHIYIPNAVYEEIRAKKSYGFNEIADHFFIVKEVEDSFSKNLLLNDLDAGEAEAIVLANEMKADIVIIDENIGYRIAKSQGLNVKRTLSFLIAWKKAGKIDTIKPILDEMLLQGRWISKKVYHEVLMICGEGNHIDK